MLLSVPSLAQYNIRGELADSGPYQYVHLQYVASLDHLRKVDMEKVLQSARIDSTGNFEISGVGLPEGEHLYLLLLGENSIQDAGIGITSGERKNYIYLILSEPSNVGLHCPDISRTFAFCGYKGSPQSAALAQLTDETLPSLLAQFRKGERMSTETSRQFFIHEYNSKLKSFADTCSYLLPSLVALHLMEDLESDYQNDPAYYESFIQKVGQAGEDSPYAREFFRKIKGFRETYFGPERDWSRILLPVFVLLTLLAWVYVFYQKRQLNALQKRLQELEPPNKPTLDVLSDKEREVFDLIAAGHTNKEIAQTLFIETSTVKSHINKIYQKLGIRSRSEVKKWHKG